MSEAKTQARSGPSARRSAWSAAALLLVSDAAMACHGGAVNSALQAPQVSGKFSLASAFCAQGTLASVGLPATSPVAPASSHAQQLSMYEPTPAAASGGIAWMPEPDARPPVPGLRTPPAVVPSRLARSASRDSTSRAIALVPQISRVAEQYGIDPLLLHAIAHVESRHNPAAMSHAGAVGLMQVMPATARRFGVTSPHSELRDPRISLEVSSAYLKTLQRRFDNNLPLIIAAYNAGEGAVEKYGRRIPPYKETQGYVRDVLAHYRLLVGTRDAARAATRAAL